MHSFEANLGEFAQSVIDTHVIESSLFKPPSWFVELTKKQVNGFIKVDLMLSRNYTSWVIYRINYLLKIFELIERSQTTATDKKITQALASLNLGLGANDLRDLKDIYEIRNFANLDFEEFVYSLASIDQVKKVSIKLKHILNERSTFS